MNEPQEDNIIFNINWNWNIFPNWYHWVNDFCCYQCDYQAYKVFRELFLIFVPKKHTKEIGETRNNIHQNK